MPTVMSLVRAVLVTLALAPSAAAANDWLNLATISMTDPVTAKLANRYVCYTDGRDIRCDSPSLYVTSGGLVGINTSNPQTQLEVNGTISASHFMGDGSGLTGVVASTGDRIVSGTNGATRMVAISDTGYISVTQGGANSAWFDPTRGLVALGVSTTGRISGTSGFFADVLTIGTGTTYPDSPLTVSGSSTAGTFTGTGAMTVTVKGGSAVGVWRGIDFRAQSSWPMGRIALLQTGAGSYLALGTSNAYANGVTNQALTIDPSGKIGISNTAPVAKLDVFGTISASDAVQVGQSSLTCSAGISGSLRYSNTSSTLEYCNSTAWTSLGPSDTSPVSFFVRRNVGANQTVTASMWTKMQFDSELWDTNNNFDSATNYRFTPTVPGKYLFIYNLFCPSNVCFAAIYKNGAAVQQNNAPAAGYPFTTSIILSMNGSTDYVEAFAFNSGGTAVGGTVTLTNFSGSLLGPQAGVAGGGATVLDDLTDVNTAGAAPGNVIRYDGSNWVVSSSGASAAGVSGSIQFKDGNGNLTGRSDLVVSSSGYVGIGTTAPSSTLTVDSANNIAGGSNFTNGVAAIAIRNATANTSGLLLDQNQIEQVSSSHILYINYNSGAATSINYGGGNVGVGRALGSIIAKLDVSGTISASDAIQVGQSTLTCGTGISGSIRYNTTSDTLQVCTGSGWKSMVSGTAAGLLSQLGDVSVTGVAASSTLVYNGSKWVPGTFGGGFCMVNGPDVMPVMNAATTSGVTVSANSEYSGSYPAWSAFDNSNSDNSWATANGVTTGWLRVQFSSGRVLAGYSLEQRSSDPNGMPNTWTIEGSNNGSSWTTLDSRAGVGSWSIGQKRYYTFSNTTSYTYYRISISAINGGGLAAIGEMEWFDGSCTSSGGVATLNDLTDVNTAGAAAGSVIRYDGSNWVVSSSGGGTLATLTDTSATAASNNQILQYNGSLNKWVAVSLTANSFVCPAGFTMIQSQNQVMGCMQTAEQGSATWENATNTCFTTYGGRLPSHAEWYTAMNNYTLTGETGNWEWLDDFVGEVSPYTNHGVVGNTALTDMGYYAATTVGPYRCFIPTNGTVNVSASSALGDRITSGTAPIGVIVNSATSYISLTSGATTWGYLSSGASYLPKLGVGSTPSLSLDVSGSGRFGGIETPLSGIGLEVGYYAAGDMAYVLGYDRGGTRYTGLTLNNFMYVASGTVPKVGVGTSTPVATLTVSGTISATNAIQVSGSSLTCNAGLKGAMRYSNVSSTIEYCQGTAWLSMGPSATDVPAFRAVKTVDQTVVANTWTLVTWTAEDFDTYNNFASNRFTPTLRGKYLITGSIGCANGSAGCGAAIYKNGSVIAQSITLRSGGLDVGPTVTTMVDMNGSTDYVELMGFNGNSTVIYAGSGHTTFSGSLIASGNGLISGTTGGIGVSAMASLTDVQLTNLAGRDYLRYDAGTSKWVNISESAVMSTTTMVPGWPDALVCNVSNPAWGPAIFYLRHAPVSSLYYYRGIDANSNYDVVFNANGTFNSYNGMTTTDCNTTIAASYAAGRAFNFIGSTAPASDRITSGTINVMVNAGTGYVSLTNGATTWGYLSSNNSYLQNISASLIQAGQSTVACTSGVSGSIRYNTVSDTLQICTNSGWKSLVSGTAVSAMSALTDVQLTNLAGRDYLRYDAGTSKWVNISESTAMSTTTMRSNWPDAIFCSSSSYVGGIYLYNSEPNRTDSSNVAFYRALYVGGYTYVAFTQAGAYSSQAGLGTTDCTQSISQLYAGGKAFNFIGNAAGSAGFDRITSGTTPFTQLVAVSDTRYVSITQGGANTAWFDPTRGLVTLGVSATGGISGTNGYFSGNVGIGTTNPQQILDVAGMARIQSGLEMGATGAIEGWNIYYNSGWKYRGTDTGYLWRNNGNTLTLQAAPTGTANGTVSTLNTALTISSDGKVGIGGATPAAALDVAGNISTTGGISVTGSVQAYSFLHPSDRRLKDDIKTIANADEILGKLRGTHFRWKSNGEFSYGLIAQEVEEVVPEMVKGADSKVVDYDQLSAILIEGWKNHQKSIQALEAANDDLRHQLKAANDNQAKAIEGLERRMRKLEAGGARR